MSWSLHFPLFNVFIRWKWTNCCWPRISQTAWIHKNLDWSRWPEICENVGFDVVENLRTPIKADKNWERLCQLSVWYWMLWVWSAVVMVVLAEHLYWCGLMGYITFCQSYPPVTRACLHAHSTHFPMLVSLPVSFRVEAWVVCAVTDRRRLFILTYTQPAGWTWIYRRSLSLFSLCL